MVCVEEGASGHYINPRHYLLKDLNTQDKLPVVIIILPLQGILYNNF